MYTVGQLFKNSPQDDSPFFILIDIKYINKRAYYTLRELKGTDTHILHYEDLHLYTDKKRV